MQCFPCFQSDLDLGSCTNDDYIRICRAFPEDVPAAAAQQLIDAGYVKRVKKALRPNQVRVDSLTQTTEQTEPAIDTDASDALTIDDDSVVTSDPDEKEEQV